MDDLKDRELMACDPKRLLDEKRSEANRRERSRVKALTDNFDSLVEVIPRDVAEPRLARIEIVRRACGYIHFLTDLLKSDRPDQTETRHPSAWDYIPAEEDDLDSGVLRNGFLDLKGGVEVLPMKRVECNARARSRSKDTKAAFQMLKDKLPLHGTEPELSRLDILRRATDYIACMTLLLEEADGEPVTRPKASSTPSTPSTPSNGDRDSLWGSRDFDASDQLQGTDSVLGTFSSPSLTPDRQSYNQSPSGVDGSSISRPRLPSVASTPSDSDYGTCSPTSVCSESFFSFDDISSVTSVSRTRSSPCTSPALSRRRIRANCSQRAHPYAPCSFSPAWSSRTPSPYEPVFQTPTRSGFACSAPSFSQLPTKDITPALDLIDLDWLENMGFENDFCSPAPPLPSLPTMNLTHL